MDKIKKRNGKNVDFDENKITHAIFRAAQSVGGTDKIRAEELTKLVVKTIDALNLVELDVEAIQDVVEKVLMENGHAKTAKAYILYRSKRADLRQAKENIGIDDDADLSLNALKVLEGRYLIKDENGRVCESPLQLFQRVAENVALADLKYTHKEEVEKISQGKDMSELNEELELIKDSEYEKTKDEFFNVLKERDFLPNSPTLMNAGTSIQQLAACFVLPVGDAMDEIFEAIKNTALIHQSGGGTGFSFTRLRPKGDLVKSTGGVASGPISFMKVFNAATEVIKQGGKRRGANMGILRIDHPDILDFIVSKEKEDQLNNFNISVGLTENFMKAVEEDTNYDLINPRSKLKAGQLNARRVFNLIVTMAWKSGEPGIIFLDRLNRDNPTPNLGEIESTNPCVVEGSLVSTDQGLVKIENLLNKEVNLCVDVRTMSVNSGNLKLLTQGVMFNKMKKAIFTGEKQTINLRTQSGYEIGVTEDHKILTDKGWVEANNLDVGDNILIQSREGKFSDDYEINFENNFCQNWTKELGQITGWLIGDGWLKNGEDCRVGFVFGGGDDKILNYLKPKINSIYKNEIKEIERNGVTHLSYHSKSFVDFFENIGVKAKKASEKRVPNSIFTAPKEVVVGFLQGLFSADGTISTHKKNKTYYIRLTSKSEELLRDTQLLLLNLGIKSKIYARHRSKRLTFSYKTIKGEMKFYETDGICYELQVSKDMIPIFIEKVGFMCDKHKEKVDLLKNVNFYSTKFYDPLVLKTDLGIKKVYDLTEDISHSFVANGIVVHNCGEQPLLPYESCNLGSINLSNHVVDGKVDWDKLEATTKTSIHFLDNVIDMGKYPLQKISDMVRGNRKIGLGVMGWADMLIKLKIRYDSDEGYQMAERVMKFIAEKSQEKSMELAKIRGTFPNYEGSTWDDKGIKIRNATLTTIAPTGSISIIASASSGVEPLFAISYLRKTPQFEFLEVNPLFEEIAREEGFYSESLMKDIARHASLDHVEGVPDSVKKYFVTAHDISPEGHVQMQAAFQRHIDNAVSKTVNFPNMASNEDVANVYQLAHKLGCKGLTIYRDGSRGEQVLNIQTSKPHKEKCPDCASELVVGEGCMSCQNCGYSKCSL